jgi:cytochrome P450
MILFPEVKAKAKKEIDTVIGHDRLPTIADRPLLPYLCALVSEVHRYGLVVAFIPRICRKDDIYNGYLIPKGTITLQNTWYDACTQKKEILSEADKPQVDGTRSSHLPQPGCI